MLSRLYHEADELLLRALPELRPSYRRHLAEWAPDRPGHYLVYAFNMGCFLEILLAMPSSPARDRLVQRTFDFVERLLLSGEHDVRDLGFITVYEGMDTWWIARAAPFIGPAGCAELDDWLPDWRRSIVDSVPADPVRAIFDSYGVRKDIFRAMRSEGVALGAVPGVSSLESRTRLDSLDRARRAKGAVVLSCYGTTRPYVVGPATTVACDEAALIQLARDLAEIVNEEPRQYEKARSVCYLIPMGERVPNMRSEEEPDGRYRGKLWIASHFVARDLTAPILQVLAGEQRRLLG